MVAQAQDESLVGSQESRNIAALTWVGSLFFSFIPSLIVYIIKKDDLYLQSQAKEALNWSITAILGYVTSLILMFVLVGALVFPVVAICHLAFCIMGAISTSKGNAFRAPFAVRLVR